MEKFAVDLDKVLDDFEYNEEQAVRHNQYLQEDLPAKKYQRPPFQRINLADADFSPSRQTSSPVIPYILAQPASVPSAASNAGIVIPIKSNGASVCDEDVSSDSFDDEQENVADVNEPHPIPDLLGKEIYAVDDSSVSLKLPDLTEIGSDGIKDSELVTCDLITHTNESELKLAVSESQHIIRLDVRTERGKESRGRRIALLDDSVVSSVENSSETRPESNEIVTKAVSFPENVNNSNFPKDHEISVKPVEIKEEELKAASTVDNITTIRARATTVDMFSTETDLTMEDSSRAIEMTKSFEIDVNPFVEEVTNGGPITEIKRNDVNALPTVQTKKEVADDAYVEVKAITADSLVAVEPDVVDGLPSVPVRTTLVVPEPDEAKILHVPDVDTIVRREDGATEKLKTIAASCEEGRTKAAESVLAVDSPHVLEVEPDTSVVNNDEEPESSQKERKSAKVYGELEMVKPVEYLPDSDIPDEDLERFLEELEEEEVENSVDRTVEENMETENVSEESEQFQPEGAPQRPNYLELNGGETGAAVTSAGTPLVREKEPSEDLDNEINERGEAAEEDRTPSEPYRSTRVEAVDVPPDVAESPPPPTLEERRLGKVSPFWVPDADALNCMQCGLKFTVIKRRHHCRACGHVLCGKCCGMRASLEYLSNQEHRVCEACFRTLTKVMMYEETDSETEASPRRRPNPNNPMEYCSTVPPPLQASPSGSQPPPSVLVPVLKREGSTKNKETPKKVMFSDGIRPGGELTALDEPPVPKVQRSSHGPKRVGTPPGSVVPSPIRMLPPVDPTSQSFILEQCLPPVCEMGKGNITYHDPWPRDKLMERLRAPDQPPLLFAVNRHLIVSLKIVKKDCCMGQTCWTFSTRGMVAVGQDEILVLLQMTGEENEPVPCEVFMQLHYIHQSADKGNSVGELGYWSVKQSTFLDSRQHGGFLFVRPSFQCVQNLERPAPPYLVAILIHRLELPWARQFPLRLMLRLGAEFRYYPCSLVSVRHREPVYYEIGQTIMNLLADFRSYTFTLPAVRGLRIHMEAQQTCVLIPRNRYDQVVRALNNSNDPVLALAGTFSPQADAHLVCMQSKGDEVTYSTQAINIHDKPRKVTGASFVVFNASLKAAGGVMGKSHIVEDGLMVEVSADTMVALRSRLRALEDWSVRCGAAHDELIQVTWCEDEKDFNRGVRSAIDGTPLDGVPSIRVHNGTDYMCGTRFIRWTEVFIIKCEDGTTSAKIGDPLEVNRLSENIARATCTALTKAKLLDLLAAAGSTMLALRTTVTQDSVCYEAGSNGEKLAPIYMNSLDNELIPVLHKATANNSDACAILELVFHVLDQ